MKIECNRERLQNSVSKAEKISGRNLSLPILQCLLLVVKNNTISIKSTNLDLGVDFTLQVKVEKEGVVAVPALILSNYISNLQSKNVVLELVGTNLKISSDGNTTLLKTFPYEDFPLIPALSQNAGVTLNPQDFLRGLKSVFYSSSLSSVKPELSSVYLYTHEGMLVFAATDSFRLAEKQLSFKEKKELQPTLIPIKNISEIVRVLEDTKGPLSFTQTKNQVAFFGEDFYLTSRVIEGVFPDYRQIIPKVLTTEAVFLKQDAVHAFRLATLFSDKTNQVSLTVNPRKKIFRIAAKNSDLGESTQSLPATLSGEDIDIRFNYKYLTDCFSSIPSETVQFSFSGSGKPLIISGRNDRTFTYLVMPMNR